MKRWAGQVIAERWVERADEAFLEIAYGWSDLEQFQA
jgi:hypothetical protein